MTLFSILLVTFASFLSIDLYHYYRLNQIVPVEHIETSVQQTTANRFVIAIDYQYVISGKTYSGHQEIKKKMLKNIWVAKQFAQDMVSKDQKVWYNLTEPHLGSIDKVFPVKRLFYTCLLLGLFIYFSTLVNYLFKRV